MIARRAAVDALLVASGVARTSAYDWLGIVSIHNPYRAARAVLIARVGDAEFFARQRQFDAALAACDMQEAA